MINTPNLYRIAAQDVRLTQILAGAPVCARSRSVRMTGQNTGHTHARGNAPGPDMTARSLRDSEASFFLYLALTILHANNERSRGNGDGAEVPDHGIYEDTDWPASDKGQAAMITRMD